MLVYVQAAEETMENKMSNKFNFLILIPVSFVVLFIVLFGLVIFKPQEERDYSNIPYCERPWSARDPRCMGYFTTQHHPDGGIKVFY